MKISRERRNQPEPDGGQAQSAQEERLRADDGPDRQVVQPGPDVAPGDPDMPRAREAGTGDPQSAQRGHENMQPQHEAVPPGAGVGTSPASGQGGERVGNTVAQANPRAGAGHTGGNGGERVLAEADLGRLRDEWREVQTMFVDDPRDAVTRANGLVEGTIAQLTETYAQRRQALENKWSRSDRDDTEELRQALRGYRQLFDQLLDTAGAATNM